ncbi:MAG TPA: type II toxin-antitoxin system VapC family toxin [Bosea sp. (in: a-proteobacteria)]|jgi:predicted nucleic acid-binding protein|nr:type II toxin-antitoxin system VapC family toxin [Bosea sp. (in: a-proteobacteria)]
MTGVAVVDASVAMKWFVDEEDSDKAELLLRSRELIAPAIILSEVGNGLWSKRGFSGIEFNLARDLIGELPQLLNEIVPIEGLMKDAMQFAFDLDHPIYDCLYLALANQRRLPLVTADKRFIGKLEGQDLAIPVIALPRYEP